jgi:hypothetical protein
MPRVTGKVDAGIKLHQLSRGIACHAQKTLKPNSLICQIKLLPVNLFSGNQPIGASCLYSLSR